MLRNVLIQSHFDYACTGWYPNLTENSKKKMQIMQSKNIRFCLRLDKMQHISLTEFRSINWLPTKEFIGSTNAITFKFVNKNWPFYLNKIFEFAPHCRIDTRNSFAKLKHPLRKTNKGQKTLSYISPSLWNNLPKAIKKRIIYILSNIM